MKKFFTGCIKNIKKYLKNLGAGCQTTKKQHPD